MMKISQFRSIKTQVVNKQAIYSIGVVLGTFAFIFNAFFVVSIVGSVPIYFGGAFVLLCLLTLPFHVALLALAASLAPLLIFDSPASIAWLHGVQFFVVAVLLYFQVRFLTALLLFWLLIGLPIASMIVDSTLSVSPQISVFIALPFVLSGLISGMVAILVYWLLPVSSQFRQVPALPKFSKVVFEFNLVSIMLPFFVVLLFLIWRSTHDSQISLSLELDNALEELNRSSIGLLDDKVHALTSTATLLINEKDTKNHAGILNTVANASADIESMIVTDEVGGILLAAPAQYAAKLPNLSQLSISFRDYFQQTKEREVPIISAAIRGTGLGSLDIVAITAPILSENGFEGLVQAAIKLDRLVDQSVINAIQNGQIAVIVLDAKDSIIYSSPKLGLQKLDTFQKQQDEVVSTFLLSKMIVSDKDYLYRSLLSPTGWKIYTLTEPGRIFKDTNMYFIFMVMIFVQSIILITILSRGLASNMVRPLHNLESFIKGHKSPDKLIAEAKVSQEIFLVTESVINTQKLAMDFQHELKNQVEEKTKELLTLNSELLRVSRKDSLTGLFNRGAFDTLAQEAYMYCRRNKKAFTLTIIDIDYFKKVNDTYGHNAGDQCLVTIADLMARMCRRDTDIVARYGGEEFALFFASDKPEQHIEHITAIAKAIAEEVINYDDCLIQLTVSCGAVRVENDFSKEMIELISLADKELYTSKNQGRNQVNTISI